MTDAEPSTAPPDAVDVRELGLTSLADHGEYKVLAARADAGDTPSMALLAARSNDPLAFRWAWALLRSGKPATERFSAFAQNVGAGVEVPPDLQGDVIAFLIEDHPTQQARQRGTTPTEAAQEKLLASLSEGFAQEAATRLLTDGPPQLRTIALTVLGRSRDRADRNKVIEATGEDGQRDLQLLTLLSTPLEADEQHTVSAAVLDHLSRQLPDAAVDSLRTLASRLAADALVGVLRKASEAPGAGKQIIEKDVLQSVPLDVIRDILAAQPALPDTLTEAMVTQLAQRIRSPRNDEAEVLAVWLHEHFPGAWTDPIRKALQNEIAVNDRMGRPRNKERRARDLGLLRQFVEVNGDLVVIDAYAEIVRPGELCIHTSTSPTAAARFGKVAGSLIRRDADTFTDDVVEYLSQSSAHSADVAGGFTDGLSSSIATLPGLLASGVLHAGSPAIAAAAASGHQARLVDAALHADNPTPAANLLCTANTNLDAEQTASLLAVATWSSVPTRYPDLIDALGAGNPDALLRELVRATASLADDRNPIGDDAYAHLVTTSLDTGQADPEALDTPISIQRLLEHPDPRMRDLALRWAAAVTPAEQLVAVVADAADTVTGMDTEFAACRRAIAMRLTKAARTTDADVDERVRALTLAARAHEGTARTAAFELAHHRLGKLRRAAVQILADTTPQDGDEERLKALLAGEGHREVQQQLVRALHRITSSSIDEAVSRLLAEYEVAVDADAAVLLPEHGWHDAVVHAIDLARRSQHTGPPEAYINALISLGDLLIEQYLIRMTELEGKGWLSDKEADLVRHNAPSKPDIGEVLRRQSIAQNVKWFATHLALRELRTGHATPRATIKPLAITDDHRTTAHRLFSMVLSAWTAAMLDVAAVSS